MSKVCQQTSCHRNEMNEAWDGTRTEPHRMSGSHSRPSSKCLKIRAYVLFAHDNYVAAFYHCCARLPLSEKNWLHF